jgi:hypothetical protein
MNTPPKLTKEQCDAIYDALNAWAIEIDAYHFGLPMAAGGGKEGARQIIRAALAKAQASEPEPKECHGCRMAEKYIKQLQEENHKLLSALKREWVGLTGKDKQKPDMGEYVILNEDWLDGYETGMEAAEAKLKELNHG